MSNCVFCKFVKKKKPCEVIYENDHLFVFLDNFPVHKGHTLVIPKKHYKDLFEMPSAVLADLLVETKKIAKAVVKATKANGINLAMNVKKAAGQAVFHAHLHIIPRYYGDGLKITWPRQSHAKDDFLEMQKQIVKYLK